MKKPKQTKPQPTENWPAKAREFARRGRVEKPKRTAAQKMPKRVDAQETFIERSVRLAISRAIEDHTAELFRGLREEFARLNLQDLEARKYVDGRIGGLTKHFEDLCAHIGKAIPLIKIDGKYEVTPDGKIRNRVSGEPIPDDEPLFLLRARDQLALMCLQDYLFSCESKHCKPSHLAGIREMIAKFARFAADHTDRMKQPGVTGDVRPDPSHGR
jgi:hypothetical protein